MQAPRAIYIASSPWAVFIASLFYLSAAMALLLVNWPWALGLVTFVLLLVDYQRVIRIYGTGTHRKAISIIQQDCDKWHYQLRSGKCYKAKLIKSRSYCCGIVIIMYLRHLTGGRYVVVPRDALSQHNYRFLAFCLNSA